MFSYFHLHLLCKFLNRLLLLKYSRKHVLIHIFQFYYSKYTHLLPFLSALPHLLVGCSPLIERLTLPVDIFSHLHQLFLFPLSLVIYSLIPFHSFPQSLTEQKYQPWHMMPKTRYLYHLKSYLKVQQFLQYLLPYYHSSFQEQDLFLKQLRLLPSILHFYLKYYLSLLLWSLPLPYLRYSTLEKSS